MQQIWLPITVQRTNHQISTNNLWFCPYRLIYWGYFSATIFSCCSSFSQVFLLQKIWISNSRQFCFPRLGVLSQHAWNIAATFLDLDKLLLQNYMNGNIWWSAPSASILGSLIFNANKPSSLKVFSVEAKWNAGSCGNFGKMSWKSK